MVCSSEALRVDLVDLLGTGGARGKPAILRKHLQPPDGGAVAWGGCECSLDFLPGEFGRLNLLGRELLQKCLLLWCRRRIDPLVDRVAELLGEGTVELTGITTCFHHHLRREQPEDRTVFVCRPHRPVETQVRSARALFTTKA